jgi:hypothetical protein
LPSLEEALATRQQPGGDTPGVAAAPVALAGAIVPGVARLMVVLSAHADVFGVGITAIAGSMLVPPSCVTSCWIAPGGGLAGISGVESGKAAPLVGGPPGTELHTVVDELPSGSTGDMVPVVLPTMDVGMVPNGVNDIAVVDGLIAIKPRAADVDTLPDTVDGAGTAGIAMEGGGGAGTAGGGGAGTVEPKISVINDVAGCADSVRYGAIPLPVVDTEVVAGAAGVVRVAEADGIPPVVSLMVDMDVTGTVGVPGAICPVGIEQVMAVPGVVGSEASGTGASVVSSAPG